MPPNGNARVYAKNIDVNGFDLVFSTDSSLFTCNAIWIASAEC
jgi:hypothetical protein